MKAMDGCKTSERSGSMARLLFCAGCAGEGRVPTGDARDETRVVKWGEMAHPGVKCDRCGREFTQDEWVAAVSVYDRPGDYWAWEGFYLLSPDPEDAGDGGEGRAAEDGRRPTPAGWSEIEGDEE
jgi:hypothetical protein